MQIMSDRWGKIFPFIKTLESYSREKGKADLFAGLTVAIVAAPQSMAYAHIAGFSPVYGLYALIFPVIISALWSSSNFLVAGPTNALCMLVYASMAQIFIENSPLQLLPENVRIQYLLLITVLAGFIQCLGGILGFGKFLKLISYSVILAFTTGAYLLIILGQIKTFLGLKFASPHEISEFIIILFQSITYVNFPSLSISLLTLFLIVAIKRFFLKAPYVILALVIASVIHHIGNLSIYGVETCLPVPHILPSVFIPEFIIMKEIFNNASSTIIPILTFALLASIESVAIGRAMAGEKNVSFSANQELISGGLGNIVAGFTFSLPSCGSFSRSAVNKSSGAQTIFSAIFSALFIMMALLLFGQFVSFIPLASLSALLMYICWNMLRIREMIVIAKESPTNRIILCTTLISVLVFGLIQAIFIGIFISFILSKFFRKII